MPDETPAADPDLVEILGKLGLPTFPPMALDPLTASLNFGTMALFLVATIIATIPLEQHAENYERLDKWFEMLLPKQK